MSEQYEADTVLGLYSMLVLAQIRREPDKSYGGYINEELSSVMMRDGTSSQTYLTIGRLVDRGYLRKLPSSGAERYGRRYFGLTEKAEALLETVTDFLNGKVMR